MELEQFRAKAKPAKRKSRLDAFHEDIATLRQDGYSLRQVCEFLESKQCKVTPQALNEWIKRRGIEETSPAPNRRGTDSQTPEKANPPSAGGDKGSDKKEPGKATAETSGAGQADSDSQANQTEELVRPPGISNGEWSKRKAEHKAKQRSNKS